MRRSSSGSGAAGGAPGAVVAAYPISCLNKAAGLKFGEFGELEPAVPPNEMVAAASCVAPEVFEMPTCKPVLNGEPLSTGAIC